MKSDALAQYQSPPRSQIFFGKLTSHEQLVLLAMYDLGGGQFSDVPVSALAVFTHLSRRTVQSIIHGRPASVDARGRQRPAKPGLIARRILVEIAPADPSQRRPATYRLQIEALQPDPRMEKYISEQGH